MPTHKLSRRALLRLASQGLAAMTLPGCCPPPGSASLIGASSEDTRPTQRPTTTPPEKPTPGTSLDAKIGQMLMVGFRGLEVGDDHFVVRDIRERNLGGVVLFDYDVPSQSPVRNVESPAQLKALVASLQAVSDIPLLVAIDHEGGVFTRLKEERGFPPTLSHQALGEIDDTGFTYEQAATMAQTLADLGINLNLAPVVDLNVNPDNPTIGRYERSFSADHQAVSRHAQAFIEAHHEQGILCAVKHFPGQGSATGDTHEGWVDVTDTWGWDELLPFSHTIELADAVMTAHVFNANFDAKDPATLSYATVGLLRTKLAYDGVVISDCMQMGAITDHYDFETAIRKAVEADVDIVAFANNATYEEDIVARAVALIKNLVEGDIVKEARIDRSYERIQRLKRALPS